MIKYYIIFNLLVINRLLLPAIGNNQDSLVKYSDIIFTTDFEKNILGEYFKYGEPGYFKLFLATSRDIDFQKAGNYSEKYDLFFDNSFPERFRKYNHKRKIKTIYRTVHSTFLNSYEFYTCFDKIFYNGDYNCVTATALFGIILTRLNIPFYIIETPIHVYIVAYPNKKHIKIESTDPYSGYFVYNQTMKRTFIEFFKTSKVIDEIEYRDLSVDELFDKYYFQGNKISLKELIGIQYMNNAAFNILEDKLIESYINMEKPYLFYPSRNTENLLYNYLIKIIPALNYEEPEDLDYLIKLTRYSSGELIKKIINYEFLRITETYLISKGESEYYDNIFRYLTEKIKNSEYLKEIAHIYYYEKGKFLISNDNLLEGHDFFKKALESTPDDNDIQSAFIQSLEVILEQSDLYEAVEQLETFSDQFSELSDNRKFAELKMANYLKAAIQSINTNNITQGEEFLKKFEILYKSAPDAIQEEHLIGEVYSAFSVFYFKRGLYIKAKECLQRGLLFAPENKQLKIGISSF